MIDPQIVQTAITAAGVVAAAALGGEGTRRAIKRRKRRRHDDVGREEREAFELFATDPGQFVKQVLESNRQLADDVKGYRMEVRSLRDELRNFQEKDRKFRNALARWFVDIMAAFEANHIDMPYPRDGDQDILADVIPSTLEATQPRIRRSPPQPT